jgi:pyrimidine operon attenuation protein/uracil phosphoribosyltransferase
MALEVAEQNTGEQEMIIAGISGNGEVVARSIQQELGSLTSLSIQMITIQLNKRNPLEVSIPESISTENKVLLIVDDVANSGRTMLYAIKPFLASLPKKIQTLVLVERSHKIFPVQSDIVGLSLSTTLQEHITVEVKDGVITGAFLE